MPGKSKSPSLYPIGPSKSSALDISTKSKNSKKIILLFRMAFTKIRKEILEVLLSRERPPKFSLRFKYGLNGQATPAEHC